MRKLVRRLVPVAVMALTPMAAVAIATPAVSSGAMRQRLVVRPNRQCVPASASTAGRLTRRARA
jgi:hypothetical protein